MNKFHYVVEAKVTHIDFLVELHMLLHNKVKQISANPENVQILLNILGNLTSVKQFIVERADSLDEFSEMTSHEMNERKVTPSQAFHLIQDRVKEANENVKLILSTALEEYSDAYIEISESRDTLLEFLPKPRTVIEMLKQNYHFKVKCSPELVDLNLDLFAKAS